MRDFDIVLFGATGFTGRLVAEYLGRTADPQVLRLALAGRDGQRLAAVRDELVAADARWSRVETLRATSDDATALGAIAERTTVVITTVGPYTVHGEPLLRACTRAGTDYVDLTGEPVWWRRMIDRYHDDAVRTNATIVPCCGFDSVPHDLGARFTMGKLARTPARVRGYVQMSTSPSGGTWASALHIASEFGRLRRMLADLPKARMHRCTELDRWALPLPTIDPLVVMRSAELSPDFGEGFAYEHYLATSKLGRAAVLVGGAVALVGLTKIPPVRRLLERARPSGSGPTRQQRERGRFRVTFIGEADGAKIRTQVSGHEPGYAHTSKMLAEAALCLAFDRDRLPRRGGVLTPASALGDPYVERLERTGMRFEVVE
jgi:saccharopine dehydrogenase (NAD+, L-glutamate forming)